MSIFRVILGVSALLLALPAVAEETAVTAAPPAAASASGEGKAPATARPVPPRPPVRRQSFNDLVRNLVAAHEVQPLRAVLEAARKASAGEVVSIKLRRQKTRWVYHVRILKQDGRRAELEIDGKSLKILERK